MGSLFSSTGLSAGNGNVVKWMHTVVLDVLIMPSIIVVLLHNFVSVWPAMWQTGWHPAYIIYFCCLAMLLLFVLLWVMSIFSNENRMVMISPSALTALSQGYRKQVGKVMKLKHGRGRRRTTDNDVYGDLTSAQRESRRNAD
jgi:hypothetical protein